MPDVKIGDLIRDNDPRQGKRRIAKVMSFSGDIHPGQTLEPHADCEVVQSRHRKGARFNVRVPLSKIHSDGKRRKSGWDLLPAQAS